MSTGHDDHGHDHGHHHHHDHDHDHLHPYDPEHHHPHRADQDDSMTYYRLMEEAVRELMIDKGLVTADDIRAEVEAMDARSPANGALVVARAWTDPDFKKRLIASPKEAIAEVGHDIGPMKLIVLENTPEVHNVVVCTLCSCYPRWILGIPPDWYKSRSYRSRVVREPRAVLREFGTEIADNRAVRVHDSTADMRYMVLPMRPEGTDGMSEEALAALVHRDSMIGVTEVTA
ncbi:nitrile hydratase subunit alpha [uncultured Nisaea sp.]|uniref:nitrile hydratase subunit alpha n=1 Tax=uncultured Nisaea sp. TaxID=538215 RepID=UPI0030EEE115|tara:strand:+ start:3714 stop:4406 length:693 start_codon:yes stop_codon:yes gene_type:complete